jgi:MFS family permease
VPLNPSPLESQRAIPARCPVNRFALPTISIDFDSSMAVVQWIPLAYQLTIIGFVLSLARLGDIRGRKKSMDPDFCYSRWGLCVRV